MAGAPSPVPWPWALLAHAASAALVFFCPPREKGWLQPTRHWAEALGPAALLVPGLGWLAAGFLLWRRWDAPLRKDAYRFDEDSSDAGNAQASLGTASAIRRDLADALDVLPAADALMSQDQALKRGAIETLARIRTPDSVGWILRARGDSDPETRFFATSALTGLKRDYETAIRAAERESVLHPGETALRLGVQRVRFEYALSGMLDGPAREAVLLECRERLAPEAERDAQAARLAFLVERELDPAGSFAALERLERLDPARRPRWLRDRAELLFRLGRHQALQEILRANGAEAADGDREWHAAVAWWTT